MKKLIKQANEMYTKRRYRIIEMIAVKGLFLPLMVVFLIGCSRKDTDAGRNTAYEKSALPTEQKTGFEDIRSLNEDAFAWLYIPGTDINCPILQDSEGDDSFYKSHNEYKEPDENGAIHIEAANLNDMCDFNEVIYGSSPKDGTGFAQLNNFLDKEYFDEHEYVHVYMEDNSLIYYIIAAYIRDDTKLLAQYDFTYASGCMEFINEIYRKGDDSKIIRDGCETGLKPEHFLITLTTDSIDEPGKQTVVIGCLMGDVAGKIDRDVDYGDEDDINIQAEW
ncbi:class B sortase [Butyrivibrio sp. INlla21]|uniref:class B sortase n=1 Tax=Butyrivibrio sp. INlla21 TaxID=1520811 RepID=UPI0015A5EE99|nr:class B sortase [Butyrivibrio sp. INlla21]